MIHTSPRRVPVYLLLFLIAVPLLAHSQSEPSTGDIQILRNPRESVAVFPRISPVDKSGALVGRDDLPHQVRQALENLRRLAARVGISPGHFVTLTLYVKEKSASDGLVKVARESFSDWSPAMTVVETKELRVVDALVEVEGVAIVRPGR